MVTDSFQGLGEAKKPISSSGPSTPLRMEPYTRASGSRTYAMGLECRFGRMGLNTRAAGNITRLRAVESSGTPTETSLMVIGKRTKQMDLGPTHTLTGQSMRESG